VKTIAPKNGGAGFCRAGTKAAEGRREGSVRVGGVKRLKTKEKDYATRREEGGEDRPLRYNSDTDNRPDEGVVVKWASVRGHMRNSREYKSFWRDN